MSNVGKIQCPKCGKKFEAEPVKEYRFKRWINRVYECPYCGFIFRVGVKIQDRL
ncbi:MAG: hypothetical protein J7L11_04655 [Thermoprotei archaeon]|nr:hypothetical protein [Thermoprotei archaeon]